MRTDLEIDSRGTALACWHYPASSDDLTSVRGRPCVVMAHGFGATKDAGLVPYAERFQAAGADVVLFDYRGFGSSAGDKRQSIDHRRHREDYRAVVAHVRTMPDVDPARVVLWGSSYSGGHVVAVAAGDPRIAGVISQGAAMDGLAAVMLIRSYAGVGQLLRLTGHAIRDVGAMALGGKPHLIPIVGPPGTLAAISSHDGESGYQKIMGPTFRNEMRARGILPIMVNRPVTKARKLHMPVYLVVAAKDTIAPVGAVERVARKVSGPVEVERFDVGHFDIYDGEPFEESVTGQVEFVRSLFAIR